MKTLPTYGNIWCMAQQWSVLFASPTPSGAIKFRSTTTTARTGQEAIDSVPHVGYPGMTIAASALNCLTHTCVIYGDEYVPSDLARMYYAEGLL